MQRDRTGDLIKVTYYQGNESPIIRISIASLKMLIFLKSIFGELATGKYQWVDFQQIDEVQFSGLKGFVLRRIEGNVDPRKSVRRTNQLDELPIFEWSATSQGWDDNVFWIDGMLSSVQPGHQYFSDEGQDDALIVIAFGEG